MSVGNTNENGNGARSNFNWQNRMLQATAATASATAALATEATLQQVLLALQDGSEYEVLLVSDTGNANLVVRQVTTYDTAQGILNPPVYFRLDGTAYTPIGPLAYVTSGAVTNDGTFATPALQSAGNTSLSSIDTKTPSLGQALAAASVPVVLTAAQLATLTPVSGGATAALQTSGNTSLSSIDGKTPALGQALAAASVPVVLTAAQLATLTPVTSVTVTQATGTNLHAVVDSGTITSITNALPSGTNILGKTGIDQTTPGTTNNVSISTAAKGATTTGTPTSRQKSADVQALDVQIVDASGVQITTFGSSSLTSVIPGTGATNLGKAEDAAHTTGDTGVFILGVRNDNQTAFSGTDLDYTPIATDTYGSVKITGDVADNAVQVNTKPVYMGGKAVQTSTYTPTYTAGDAAGFAIDKDNGGVLVNQANLTEATDVVSSVYGEVTKATYSAATLGLLSAASATDIFTIIGSGTKTVRIRRLEITGFSASGGMIDVQIIKRSAADTTGTSTTLTAVPHDSNNSAATAVVKAYTANPGALGAAVGPLVNFKMVLPIAAGTNPNLPVRYTFGEAGCQNIVLRGAAENIAINLNGVTVTGGNFDITITWSEE